MSLQSEFQEFHFRNPQVYNELVRLARVALARGRKQIGIGWLWEVLRWNFMMAAPADDFKMNNNHRSRYARLIMSQEADLLGVFEIRELRSSEETTNAPADDGEGPTNAPGAVPLSPSANAYLDCVVWISHEAFGVAV